MKIKDWHLFQHYKDRKPPWIKIYRDLLDDPEWHELPGDSTKVLIMLWLIASESKDMSGDIPAIKTLAFRLRITEAEVNRHIITLSHWIEYDASELLADSKQDAIPETETETETEERKNSVRSKKRIEYSSEFQKLWEVFPGVCGSKKKAFAEYNKAEIGADEMALTIQNQIEFKSKQSQNKEFVSSWPHMYQWIKDERWNDKLKLSNSENRQHERKEFSFPEGEEINNEM